MTNVKLAHLTDIHLPIAEAPTVGALMNKRFLGYLSWTRNRRKRHKKWVSDLIAADVTEQQPDAALISGDIVNISLPNEFANARRWLEQNFSPDNTMFAPGNHDAYVRTGWAETQGQFSAYMRGVRSPLTSKDETDEDFTTPRGSENDFPYYRSWGNDQSVVVVAANSSPPKAPGLATGCLGASQIEEIATMLKAAGARNQFRILMLHHPITQGAVPRRKALDDLAPLCRMLSETGVELVLHGHAHRLMINELETTSGNAPVIGGGSASHPIARGHYRPGQYNLFTVSRSDDGGWRTSMEVRQLNPDTRTVQTSARHQFDIG